MIGIPFHSEAGCPSGRSGETTSGVPVVCKCVSIGGAVDVRTGTEVKTSVGTTGIGWMGMEQAEVVRASQNRLAAMNFFTKLSHRGREKIITESCLAASAGDRGLNRQSRK